MYRVALPIGTVFQDEGVAFPAPTRSVSSCSMFAPIASRARWAGLRGKKTRPQSTCTGSTVGDPTCAANRCASSSTSRAESVRGISLLICFSVQPSAELPLVGCGVMAMLLRTIRCDESAWPAPGRSGRLDGADTHPEPPLDLSQQPGGELLVRGVFLFDPFQNLILEVCQHLKNSYVVP